MEAEMNIIKLGTILAAWSLLALCPFAIDAAQSSAETPFEKKQAVAMKQVQEEMNLTGWPKTAEAALELFEEKLAERMPLYKGYDHNFEAFAKLLANYAREKSEKAKYKNKAPWLFVAGEAMYAHAKSGKEDFQNFLRTQILKKNDPRIATAKERLKSIERFEKGMSRK